MQSKVSYQLSGIKYRVVALNITYVQHCFPIHYCLWLIADGYSVIDDLNNLRLY